ncbi:HAD family hydrolase [Paenibacillus sp. CN-4]|uniref:HAD family hydrolase n=1 Tax=Paenibacillus nanchangensis TaxID=3348343 RepID=UPI003978DA6E
MNNNDKLAVFFDLDDTLYDHLIPFREAVREVVRPDEAGLSYPELFHLVRHHSDLLWPKYLSGELELEETRELRLVRAFEEFGMPLDRPVAAQVQKAYIGRQYEIEMMDGVLPILERLLDAGHPVGIITNGPEDHQMNKIRALGVDRLIPPEMIFISDAVGLAKPDPEIFAYANRQSDTRPEQSLYVGDTWQNDVAGALAAGWRVCWFNPRGREPGTDCTPTHVFRDYREFMELPIIRG